MKRFLRCKEHTVWWNIWKKKKFKQIQFQSTVGTISIWSMFWGQLGKGSPIPLAFPLSLMTSISEKWLHRSSVSDKLFTFIFTFSKALIKTARCIWSEVTFAYPQPAYSYLYYFKSSFLYPLMSASVNLIPMLAISFLFLCALKLSISKQ